MTPGKRRAAPPGKGTATSRNTDNTTTLRLGSGKGGRIRDHRRVCREGDRQVDRIYGIAEPYPYPEAS